MCSKRVVLEGLVVDVCDKQDVTLLQEKDCIIWCPIFALKVVNPSNTNVVVI